MSVDVFESAWGRLVIEILEDVKEILSERIPSDYHDAISESISKLIIEGVDTVTSRLPTLRSKELRLRAFQAFSNTHDTLNSLQTSIRFLRQYPRASLGIEHHEYLQYHAESYFFRVYNLRERLLKIYPHIYKETSLYNDEIQKILSNDIRQAFRPLVDSVRNPIVHSFSNYEPAAIKQMRMLGLLKFPEARVAPELSESKYYTVLFDANKSRARIELYESLCQSFDSVLAFMNKISSAFKEVIMDGDKRIRLPLDIDLKQ